MYTKQTNLFSATNMTLRAHLSARLERIQDAIEREDLPTLEKTSVSDRVASANVQEVSLRRSEATFETSAGTASVTVTMLVPVNGDERLLEHAPDNVEPPRLRAGLTDDLEWARDGGLRTSSYENERFSGRHQSGTPGFWVERTFQGEPTPDHVKAWGKQICDQVEAVLTSTRAQVEAYNRQIESQIAGSVESRRRSLRAAAAIDDMGSGV